MEPVEDDTGLDQLIDTKDASKPKAEDGEQPPEFDPPTDLDPGVG